MHFTSNLAIFFTMISKHFVSFLVLMAINYALPTMAGGVKFLYPNKDTYRIHWKGGEAHHAVWDSSDVEMTNSIPTLFLAWGKENNCLYLLNLSSHKVTQLAYGITHHRVQFTIPSDVKPQKYRLFCEPTRPTPVPLSYLTLFPSER
ncbi:hypothetical protein JVU11DRAFT_8713 [Chiua virens]|nr:hypothetical protein JVU11DRAFT_8713 [Chiua virens]